jgi:hypothetical protein
LNNEPEAWSREEPKSARVTVSRPDLIAFAGRFPAATPHNPVECFEVGARLPILEESSRLKR